MGKESKKKAATGKETEMEKKPAAAVDPMDPDMPEDVRAYKEKLERETGKKYKYRAPKKDLPSINHMLAHGAPGDENRPRTWLELIGYPAALVLLFCISFAIFLWVNPIENSRYPRGRFSLPKKNKPPKVTSSKPPVSSGGATGNTPGKTDEF